LDPKTKLMLITPLAKHRLAFAMFLEDSSDTPEKYFTALARIGTKRRPN